MKFYSFWRSLAAFRVRIAMNIKSIVPDEVVNVDLIKGDQREEAYRQVNPQMLLPALVDGDGPILFQSIAIMEYLEETHPAPPILPKDPRGRARVRALALINAADSHPLMVPRVREFMEHELKLDDATRTKWIRHWIGEGLGAMEGHLSRDKETPELHGQEVTTIDISDGPSGPVVVSLPATRCTPPVVAQLGDVLRSHPGMTEVRLKLLTRDTTRVMKLDDNLRVTPSPALIADLKQLLGPGCLAG